MADNRITRINENAAKDLQRRSRIAQGLDVRNRVRLGLSLAAALLDGLFQHSLRPHELEEHTRWELGCPVLKILSSTRRG